MAEKTPFELRMEEAAKKRAAITLAMGHKKVEAAGIMDDILCYDEAEVVKLAKLEMAIGACEDEAKRTEMIAEYHGMIDSMKKKPDAPEKIYLWKEGNMPADTDYTDNSSFRFSHDPDYRPYLYEMLLPEDVTPKGAIVVCAGGDHGEATVHEGYRVAQDMNALGYQCILLLNRTNRCPWTKLDAGADAARAVRYARKNAGRLRIDPNRVAFAGFSNGGLTGEDCIEYFSGKKTVKDYFPDYVPDELDDYSGRPDAFLCVYGPRQVGMDFDWEDVDYPPTIICVGRKDNAMKNLDYVYPDLAAHGVTVEIHTFAGTPHGQAGSRLYGISYPNFDLWETLADSFMMDVYGIYEPETV